MRAKRTVWLSVPLLLGLLLPQEVSDRTRSIMGSLTITGDGRAIADDGELAGVAVAYNAGFKDLAFSLDRVLYHATLSRYIKIKGVAMVPG